MVETVWGMTDLQIKLFTAIGQILVAIAVGFIAWRQWSTARNKLKADLFDRRYSLYVDFLRALNRLHGGDADAMREVQRILAESRWLYGEKVADKLRKEVANPFQELVASMDARRKQAAAGNEEELKARYQAALGAASKATLVLPTIVAPHLTLQH
ncbi:hypothetical protein D7U98_05620 [Stenotrophomonas maltophilia]|uniref:Uncharacterized protein n=1 Tax=Stenotrophomonas pavanii TaxID=487698 RepID=A0A2D0APS1_9GAMM|nr:MULTISPECIES: hypothetical protein [Stenotrophomonas]MBA0394882.1 hypothetical protein [Stenotrophomonas maltophilia]MBP2482894.1 hypothetical protein [Stenotrophomonas sp. PvP093]OWR35263.1 hypothetical protein CEE55_02330 [Stenotrophomonas pavanii]DAH87225.1 MAG TPA: Mature oligodendrocyte transmembrane protein [Caudoviricetes sp.]